MDLATKSSNIKSNPLAKIISIIVSIVLCAIFTINALTIVEGANIYGKNLFDEEKSVYQTSMFKSYFSGDIESILVNAVSSEIKTKYDKEKKNMISSAYEDFMISQKYYNTDPDGIKECLVNSYFDDENFNKYSADEIMSTYHLYCNDGDNIYFENSYNYSTYLYDYEYAEGERDYISVCLSITTNESDVNKKLEEAFSDQFYVSGISSVDGALKSTPIKSQTISYYLISNDGHITANVDDYKRLKAISNTDNSICYKDGNLVSTNLEAAVYDSYGYSSYVEGLKEGVIVVNVAKENDDNYSEILAIHEAEISKFDDVNKLNRTVITCIASVLLLIIMLILQCIFAGHRKNGLKTMFVDKLPNDIHLCITGGAIGGLSVLIAVMLEYYNRLLSRGYSSDKALASFVQSNLFLPVLVLLVALIVLIFAELCTSYARQFKVDKIKFLKNSAIAFILVNGVKYLIIKPFKSIKGALGYKPESFKKQLIAYIVGYSLANLIFGVSIIFCIANERLWWLACILVLLLIVLNIVALVFAVKYIIALDKIIVSIKNNTLPDVNCAKLPNSLKMLYDYQANSKEQLSKAVADAVNNERMRVELITNVSHDLKTPLTSIISYVDLLKGCDIKDESAKEYIGILDEKGSKLKRLIEDLIEASKVTSGVITLNPVKLDLSELATQAVVEHQQEFVDNGLELIFKGDKQSCIAFADGQKTFRVIENLLSNARKYSAKGSRVYADVYEQNGIAIFEIKNISSQALDITPDELKKRFVRGDKSRNLDGNGLGLSIADNLCVAMNGRLEIHIDGDLFKAKVCLPKR